MATANIRYGLAEFPRLREGEFMAANPNIVSQVELSSEKQTMQVVESKPESKPMSLRKCIRRLLIEMFEGHQEFLGRTPD
jgi:hypothetical protein